MDLYEHQRVGVDWLLTRENAREPRGGFLCDEMGLGKTIQILETMRQNPLKRTLIVVPKSIVTQWKDECLRFDMSVSVYDGPKRVLDPNSSIVLVPYSVIMDLDRSSWDRIILDEGHEIRNPKTKAFKALCRMSASVRWVLSGTPIFNSMRDFVTLCSFVGITAGTVAREFDQIRDKYVLRRTKDTSNMSFENIELDMYDEERELYTEAFLAGQGFIREKGHAANTMEMLECLLRVRQVMIWPQTYIDGMAQKNSTDSELFVGRSKKHEMLLQMLEAHPTEKALIFTQFTGETDRLQTLLIDHNFPVYRLDGGVDTHERVERIENFKRGPHNSVFLIQIRAGGVGLNLQEASRVYIMSPAWNPATELQAIGRSHRTGQTRHVMVKKFLYRDVSEKVPSIEEAIINLQMDKSKLCADVLGDTVPIPGIARLERRTIAKIFKV